MQLTAQHVAEARNINGFEMRLDKFTVEVYGELPSTTVRRSLWFGKSLTCYLARAGEGRSPSPCTFVLPALW